MANNKNREDYEKIRNQLDDSLESLLGDDDLLDSTDSDNDLPAVRPNTRHNYSNIKAKAESHARRTITSLMKFYLTEEIIEEDEYVQARKRIDEMTLSSLMFQLESAEKALITLLQTIDSGELSPRMFEVLATLQKSMLDIIKSQTMYLVAAEESVKKLSRDIEIYTDKKVLSQKEEKKQNLNRGTKNLMQSIQDEIKDVGYENIEGAEEVNPEDIE